MKNRIMVVGSANTDIILSVPRNPYPGESLLVQHREQAMGGKGANRAVSLARQGADPCFCCKLSNDQSGSHLTQTFRKEGLSTDWILTEEDAGTGAAYILLDEQGANTILSYMGANDCFTAEDFTFLDRALDDIGYLSIDLEFSMEAIVHLLDSARLRGVCTIVDAGPVRDLPPEIFREVYILSPNEVEARALTGIAIENDAAAERACRALYTSGCQNIILKYGPRGAMLYNVHGAKRFPAYRGAGDVVDTTAAGDCFMASLTFALSSGQDLEDAICYANIAAALAITKKGALPSLPYRHEIDKTLTKAKQEGYYQ